MICTSDDLFLLLASSRCETPAPDPAPAERRVAISFLILRLLFLSLCSSYSQLEPRWTSISSKTLAADGYIVRLGAGTSVVEDDSVVWPVAMLAGECKTLTWKTIGEGTGRRREGPACSSIGNDSVSGVPFLDCAHWPAPLAMDVGSGQSGSGWAA